MLSPTQHEALAHEPQQAEGTSARAWGPTARGGFHLFGKAITIIDIGGGQDNDFIKIGAHGRRLGFGDAAVLPSAWPMRPRCARR